jgi:hypothetical protein
MEESDKFPLENVNLLETFISDQQWLTLDDQLKEKLSVFLQLKTIYSDEYFSTLTFPILSQIQKLAQLEGDEKNKLHQAILDKIGGFFRTKFPGHSQNRALEYQDLTLFLKSPSPPASPSDSSSSSSSSSYDDTRYPRVLDQDQRRIPSGIFRLNLFESSEQYEPNNDFSEHVGLVRRMRGVFFEDGLSLRQHVYQTDDRLPSSSTLLDDIDDDANNQSFAIPLALSDFMRINISAEEQFDPERHRFTLIQDSTGKTSDFSRVFFFLLQAYQLLKDDNEASFFLHQLYWSILSDSGSLQSIYRRMGNWLLVARQMFPTKRLDVLKRVLRTKLILNICDFPFLSDNEMESTVSPLHFNNLYFRLLTAFDLAQETSRDESFSSPPLHDMYLHFYAHYLWLINPSRTTFDLVNSEFVSGRRIYYGPFWDSIQTLNGTSIYLFNYVQRTSEHITLWRALAYGVIELEMTKRRLVRLHKQMPQVFVTHLRALLETMLRLLNALLKPSFLDEQHDFRDQIEFFYPEPIPRYWYYTYNLQLTIRLNTAMNRLPHREAIAFHPVLMKRHYEEMRSTLDEINTHASTSAFRPKPKNSDRADGLPELLLEHLLTLHFLPREYQLGYRTFEGKLVDGEQVYYGAENEQLNAMNDIIRDRHLFNNRLPFSNAPHEKKISRGEVNELYQTDFREIELLKQVYRLDWVPANTPTRTLMQFTFPTASLENGLNPIPSSKSVFLMASDVLNTPHEFRFAQSADLTRSPLTTNLQNFCLENYIKPFLFFKRRSAYPVLFNECACVPLQLLINSEILNTHLRVDSVAWKDVGNTDILAPDIKLHHTVDVNMPIRFFIQLLTEQCFVHAAEGESYHLTDNTAWKFVECIQITTDPSILCFMLVFRVTPDLKHFKSHLPHFEYDSSVVNPDDHNSLIHFVRFKDDTLNMGFEYVPRFDAWVYTQPPIQGRLMPVWYKGHTASALLARVPETRYETVWENTKYTPVGVFLLHTEIQNCVFLISEQILGWPYPLQEVQFDFVQHVPTNKYNSNWLSVDQFFLLAKPTLPSIDGPNITDEQRASWVADLLAATEPAELDANQRTLREWVKKYGLKNDQEEELTELILTPITDITHPFFSKSFTMRVAKILQSKIIQSPQFSQTPYPLRVAKNTLALPRRKAIPNAYNVPHLRYQRYLVLFNKLKTDSGNFEIYEAEFKTLMYDQYDELYFDEDAKTFYTALYLMITDLSPVSYNNLFVKSAETGESQSVVAHIPTEEWNPVEQRLQWKELSKQFSSLENFSFYDPLMIMQTLISEGSIGFDFEKERVFFDHIATLDDPRLTELKASMLFYDNPWQSFKQEPLEYDPLTWFNPHLPSFQLNVSSSSINALIGDPLSDDDDDDDENDEEDVEDDTEPSSSSSSSSDSEGGKKKEKGEKLHLKYNLVRDSNGKYRRQFADPEQLKRDREEDRLADERAKKAGEKKGATVVINTGGALPFQDWETDLFVLLQVKQDALMGSSPYMVNQDRNIAYHIRQFQDNHLRALIRALIGRYLIDHGQSYPQLKLVLIYMTPLFHMLITRVLPLFKKVILRSILHEEIWHSFLKRGFSVVFVPTFFASEDASSNIVTFSDDPEDVSLLEKHLDHYLSDILLQHWSPSQKIKGKFMYFFARENIPKLMERTHHTPRIYMPTFHITEGREGFMNKMKNVGVFPLVYIKLTNIVVSKKEQIREDIINFYSTQVINIRTRQLGQFRPPPNFAIPSSSSSSQEESFPTDLKPPIFTFYNLASETFKSDDAVIL